MGIAQIENPNEAFNSANQDNTQTISQVVQTYPCSAAVTSGQLVAASYSNSTTLITVAPGVVDTTASVIGVALNTTTAAGQLVSVCVYGPALVITPSTTLDAGVPFSCGATGDAVAASTTIGSNCGTTLEESTASTPVMAFIRQM